MTAVELATASTGEAQGQIALRLTGLSKTFGSARVLTDVDLEVRAGEIRGLVGRNGSGKSTLIKVLCGYHDPDPGAHLEIAGRKVKLPVGAGESRRYGLACVHQDLGLIPEASVIDNMLVGRFDTRLGHRIPWKQERAKALDALERFGLQVRPTTTVAELRQVDRALLAIARAFLDVTEHLGEPQGRGVLILDEPTAFLPAADVERLFSAVHRAAAEGTGVIYISHRTEEILELTDSVSVLRDGVLVRTAQTGELDQTQLVELILGEQLENFYPHLSSPSNREALVVSGLSGDLVHEVSLSLNEGEIVGVTGINGAGYEELPYLLFGATPPRSGTISIKGRRELAVGFAPRRAIRGGLALLPADRQSLSGAQELTVFENVSLPLLRRFIKFGRISRRQERAAVETVLRDYAVKPPDGKALLRQLSGGNQQKALLGKWLQLQPSVLLLHEPTQGVDVGAKKEIFGRIEQAAAEGAAVLVASSEYEDLAHLCHRVVVLRDGRVTAELIGGELTEENIVREAYGSERGGASDRLVVAGVGTAGGNNER